MKNIFAIITLLWSVNLWAQSSKDSTTSSYIEKVDDKLTLRFTQSTDIEKISTNNSSGSIKLSPNLQSVSHLSAGYRFITAGFSFAPGFVPGNNDDANKGKTSRKSFGIELNPGHIHQQLSYSKTKGYYLNNTIDYDKEWIPGKPYIQLPEFVLTQFQGATGYKFNSNFSIPAISNQSEIQRVSAGSFMPIALYNYIITDNRAPLTEKGIKQKSKHFEALLGVGYFYNFVFSNRFFVALGAIPQGGLLLATIYNQSLQDTLKFHQTNAIFRLDGRMGLGYNSPRFFTGIYVRLTASENRQQNTTAVNDNTRLMGNFTIGYRLNAPAFLKNTVSKIETKGYRKLNKLRNRIKKKNETHPL